MAKAFEYQDKTFNAKTEAKTVKKVKARHFKAKYNAKTLLLLAKQKILEKARLKNGNSLLCLKANTPRHDF